MFLPGSKGSRRGSVLAAGLLSLGVAGAVPARAADDGYGNVFSSVLGSVGLIKSDPPPVIEYRERAPLVLPKDANLPSPAVTGTKRTAAWPQDPDVLQRRKEAEEARAPHRLDPSLSDKSRLATHDEMENGRAATDEPVSRKNCGNDGQHCLLLSPDEMRAMSDRYNAENSDKSETVVAGQEPAREYLTQPPKGYMKPAKAMKATREAPEPKMDEASPRYAREQELRREAEKLQ